MSRASKPRRREPKRLVLLEGSGHGREEHPQAVFDLLREFIAEHAGDGTNGPEPA